MLKRILDISLSLVGLIILLPFLVFFAFLIWFQDGYSPFYIADRVGLKGRTFRMIKLRSMIKNADKSGVDSTSADDNRITKIGHLIRQFKLDEITQLFNVLKGDMSFVGPRPNVRRAVDCYTTPELKLLTVRPGITDFASIVFSDEGEILRKKKDPDLAYDQLIRPWKSRLGLFYVSKRNLLVDLKIIYFTLIAIFSRESALVKVSSLLSQLNAPDDLKEISLRKRALAVTSHDTILAGK